MFNVVARGIPLEYRLLSVRAKRAVYIILQFPKSPDMDFEIIQNSSHLMDPDKNSQTHPARHTRMIARYHFVTRKSDRFTSICVIAGSSSS